MNEIERRVNSLKFRGRGLILVPEDPRPEAVSDRVEDAEDAGRDPRVAPIRAPRARAIPEAGQNDDEGDKVEHGGRHRVKVLDGEPGAGQRVGSHRFAHLEEVEERPEERDNEGRDDDEEKPVIVTDAVSGPARETKERS